MRKFKCSICGYVYDESAGIPEKGIAPGTRWEDIPDDFVCPVCNAPKSVFKPIEETPSAPDAAKPESVHTDSVRELSAGEISAVCSSLAKGCEKQRLLDEMEAFYKLADYYRARALSEPDKTLEDAADLLAEDMSSGFAAANAAAKSGADRGAQRSLVWSEKVSTMLQVLFKRFKEEGEAMLEGTKIYVCDICGFMMIGDEPPEICPVCKVPSYKILQVERR